MKKSDLIAKASQHNNLDKKIVSDIMDLLIDGLAHFVKQGHKIEIRNFGCFFLRKNDAHWARNPKSNEKVFVPSKNSLGFKVSKKIKSSINDN